MNHILDSHLEHLTEQHCGSIFISAFTLLGIEKILHVHEDSLNVLQMCYSDRMHLGLVWQHTACICRVVNTVQSIAVSPLPSIQSIFTVHFISPEVSLEIPVTPNILFSLFYLLWGWSH